MKGKLGAGARRAIYVFAGLVLLGIGVVGIFVPGLPTTIFLLGAAWLFARSSPRLHRYLRDHPHLGPYLRRAQERAMTRRAKLLSLAAMWIGITLAVIALAASKTAQIVVILLGLVGTAVVAFGFRTLRSEASRPVT